MRRVFGGIVMMIAALAIWAPAARGDRLRNVEVGQTPPPFSLATTDGGKLDSESLKGKVVMLVIVAAEQHGSEQAAEAAADVERRLQREDLTLVFATADTGREAYFQEFRKQKELTQPLGLDYERKLYGDLGVIVLPTTLVIDREGRLAHILSGYRPDYPQVLEAYARHTLGLIDQAELDKLLSTEQFIHDRPADRASRHRAAAQMLRQNGLLDDARAELNQAHELDPANDDVVLDLAWLDLLQDQVEAADQRVQAVLAEHPDNRQAKLMSGIVLFRQERIDEAQAVLEESLLLNPDPTRAHYYLGRIYELKGDKDKAIEHYREALVRMMGEMP